ncbi:MAG: excalibur calcium-binding domain-containing protein [Mycobacterium sp.]
MMVGVLLTTLATLAIGAAIAGGGVLAAPATAAGPPYKSCSEARADGRYNITQDDPAYSSSLDRDGDGIACESKR